MDAANASVFQQILYRTRNIASMGGDARTIKGARKADSLFGRGNQKDKRDPEKRSLLSFWLLGHDSNM
jgi:hypothetical protein